MRAYFFGNMYLSSIQQGIQAAHCLAEMFVKYKAIISEDYEYLPSDQLRLLENWAQNHKTMVLLNGGYSSTIRDLATFFERDGNTYPHASFHEGNDALDGALTCVGIILPEHLYAVAALARQNREDELQALFNSDEFVLTEWEIELIERLNQFGLAK